MRKSAILLVAGALMIPAVPSTTFAQLSPSADWATHAQNGYQVIANVTYMTATGYDSKLDVYKRRDTTAAQPTLVFYHGGGWVGGSKEASFMSILPWLEMGWNVVNVEYRMARVAPAPAAVEDATCALRFAVEKAKEYGIDPNRIVVSGESSGGHLALAVGMIPESAGFTRACAGGGFRGIETAVPKVAAIINWYGITDVTEMLGGANARSYAAQWLGASSDRDAVAKSVSPLTYVRSDLPPILSIQGDADPIVPYSQNVRLSDALTKAGAKTELMTIAGGGHGNFKPEERTAIFLKIRDFLAKNGLPASSGGQGSR
ncbi:MAG: alpha/beta hydrolase fold domain-containing protein [Luteitalea sp.]|nr:alpha/beta hydrolase fold domain-containing protein [Luteitalea sp.]